MSSETLGAQVDAATAYETLFVPALFAQWPSKLIAAADVTEGQRVLDVACGTGVLAREALQKAGPTGYVAGLDPSAGMLTVAKALAPSVDWRQGKAEAMPFPDASFDVVACQFGLMFMQREHALREMLRVVRQRGKLVAAVWDRLENIPAYAAEVALVEQLAGTQAADALRAPFTLGNRDALEQLFHTSGATRISVRTCKGIGRFPSIRVMVEADLRGWLPVMGVSLAENVISDILDNADSTLRQFANGDRQLVFDVAAHLVIASKH